MRSCRFIFRILLKVTGRIKTKEGHSCFTTQLEAVSKRETVPLSRSNGGMSQHGGEERSLQI